MPWSGTHSYCKAGRIPAFPRINWCQATAPVFYLQALTAELRACHQFPCFRNRASAEGLRRRIRSPGNAALRKTTVSRKMRMRSSRRRRALLTVTFRIDTPFRPRPLKDKLCGGCAEPHSPSGTAAPVCDRRKIAEREEPGTAPASVKEPHEKLFAGLFGHTPVLEFLLVRSRPSTR